MVHLRTVPDAWHAKVLAARLGSEGIVTHLQGAVSGPYPFGAVSVHVEASQAQLAADLLLADEVESAFTQRFSSSVRARLRADDPVGWDPVANPVGDEPPEVVLEPGDDVDLRVFDSWDDDIVPPRHHPLMSRKRRALAAFAAIMVAGAPVLVHFIP